MFTPSFRDQSRELQRPFRENRLRASLTGGAKKKSASHCLRYRASQGQNPFVQDRRHASPMEFYHAGLLFGFPPR
jgi:hypothetical protein